ncbi:MAG: hypothetical protein V4613_00245 [Bacteroidota bacterium]
MIKAKSYEFKLLLIVVVLITVATSCYRNDIGQGSDHFDSKRKYTIEEEKKYLNQKPGSWWVYQNSLTNQLDTHYLQYNYPRLMIVDFRMDKNIWMKIEYECIQRITRSSFNKSTYGEVSNTYPANNTSLDNKFILTRSIAYVNKTSIVTFAGPTNIAKSVSNAGSTTTYLGVDSAYTLHNKTYYKVLKFRVDKDYLWYKSDTTTHTQFPTTVYYWASGVGLIKYYNESENYGWELVESKVSWW